jgi:hypothetical protein
MRAAVYACKRQRAVGLYAAGSSLQSNHRLMSVLARGSAARDGRRRRALCCWERAFSYLVHLKLEAGCGPACDPSGPGPVAGGGLSRAGARTRTGCAQRASARADTLPCCQRVRRALSREPARLGQPARGRRRGSLGPWARFQGTRSQAPYSFSRIPKHPIRPSAIPPHHRPARSGAGPSLLCSLEGGSG